MHLRRSSGASPARPSGRAASEVLGRPRSSGAAARVAATEQRFARRARARRRLALKPVLAVLVVAVLVGAAAWVVLASSLLAARDVVVLGTERLAPAEVEALVADQVGTPLARVDTGGLEDRVEQLPLVGTADVVAAWPSTLEVRVVERVPVAAVAADGGFDVLDRAGRTVLAVPEPPADVPVVEVDRGSAGEGTVAAVTQVLDELPAELREQLATAGGRTRDSVELTLRSGPRVVWGSAERTPYKAEVLAALLQRPAEVYDVSSPSAPVTRDA